MATPLAYTPAPRQQDQDADARAALDQLVRLLHEKDMLRLVNNALGAGPELTTQIAELLDREGSRRLMLNLTRLIALLGELDMARIERLIGALDGGLAALEQTALDDQPQQAGISAVFKLLRDRELWEAVTGIAAFLKAFNRELGT